MGDLTNDFDSSRSPIGIGEHESDKNVKSVEMQGLPQRPTVTPPLVPFDEEAHMVSLPIINNSIDGQDGFPGGQETPTMHQNTSGILAGSARAPQVQRRQMNPSMLTTNIQVSVAVVIVFLSQKNHLPRSTRILQDIAVWSSVIGFIFSFYSLLGCRSTAGTAAQALYMIACAGSALGFIASSCMFLPEKFQLWVIFFAYLVFLAAIYEWFRG